MSPRRPYPQLTDAPLGTGARCDVCYEPATHRLVPALQHIRFVCQRHAPTGYAGQDLRAERISK